MDRERLNQLVQTFFVCNKKPLLQILDEFLTTLQAEELLPPGILMSRNYETAQENPEIHTLPGNLKDARDAIFPYFWGTDGWSSKLHLENVKGPANYASLVGAIACLLKNPNLCVDTYSQRSNELEVKAITALANLVFYHTDSPWGVFTMGGTISNLYAGKIGIEKVHPGAMQRGLAESRLTGIVSEAAHYSNTTLAGWLGIGTDNLVAIPTDRGLAMRLDLLEQRLDQLYADGRQVAFVIATFGSTDAFGMDDIAGIRAVLESRAAHHGRPVPQLHVDAAVGWSLCFLTEYDVPANPLGLTPEMLRRVARAREACLTLHHADSVTLDFHKMGWGHYPSSAFIVNRRADLRYLFRTRESMPYFSEADYRRDPALFTLECSRPAIGPYSVMASLNGLGLVGCQTLVAHAIEMASHLKERLERLENCKVLNLDTIGPSVVWWVLPRGRDAKAIFEQLDRGTLDEDQAIRYFGEIRRLFDKRSAALDPARDAKLSFTTSIGYRPHGIDIPAWKAVFFNPRTDEPVIDQILASIDDLL
jgi:glutamate/tyrosine decarboxylase-like PLP-dependent enzyme